MSTYVIKPVITEKSIALASTNTYMFETSPAVNKMQIAKLVADQFNVTVTGIRTSTLKGKKKRFRGVRGQRITKKRAYVTLKKGQKIAIFEEAA